MTHSSLTQRAQLFNALQIGLGVLLIPVSLVCWVLSFIVFRWLFYFPVSTIWSTELFGYTTWGVSFYLALACTLLLAVEGVRYAKPLFSLDTYVTSAFHDNWFIQSDTGEALAWNYYNPQAMAFLVSQFLFCAPRTAVHSYKAFRSLVKTDNATLNRALDILKLLEQANGWVSLARFPSDAESIILLRRLYLVWIHFEDDEHGEIRTPPRSGR